MFANSVIADRSGMSAPRNELLEEDQQQSKAREAGIFMLSV
jgi:hypothetical protein